ncbi:family 20 glycosylhydrolase [Maribellus sp. CM-23]|uniref:beta-N-acetylhexosaminidase n=1 Tax=Maribellus sp. CM-23 TaxID=2781026 RepID=UPI001F166BC0|nr:family 20 glycosylhydrolase [Maribellus sp. CM-23]MCE4565327.1 family 20 glycosylhydrolase [Maribellus sp. CM-23]
MRKIDISKWTAFILFALTSLQINVSWGQENQPLIPKPVSEFKRSGQFILSGKTKILIPADNTELQTIADLFIGDITELSGISIEKGERKAKSTIEFRLNTVADSLLGTEGYKMKIASGHVLIQANQPQGIFYGVQTFLQKIPAKSAAQVPVACADITDYPRFGWRGLMLDVSRHFFTKDEVKRYIDQMAKYKYNVFHWHLTDDPGWRIEIKSLPELTSVGSWRVPRTGNFGHFQPPFPGEEATDGGFYTQEDIREVVKYAQERFVTIVPEIDVPGHSLALIASYPDASCTQVKYPVNAGFAMPVDRVLCAGNEDNFKKLELIFSEVASLFPGEYVHIGGDEAEKEYWRNCPKCQQRMKTEGLKTEEELQSYFIKRVSKILDANGKKLIGWDEILEGGLAPDATVMSWRGTEGGAAAAKAGHPVIMTPNEFCYLDHTQGENVIERFGILFCCFMRMREVYKFNPNEGVADSSFVLGAQGNLWTEVVPNYRRAEYMTWPRGMALSEIMWSPTGNRNWDEFVLRIENHFPRFEQAEVNYSPAIYDPDIEMVETDAGEYQIVFTPEIKGLDIYYTFDMTFPDKFYPKYKNEPISIPSGATEIWAITYRDGKPLGRLLVITLDELKNRLEKKK